MTLALALADPAAAQNSVQATTLPDPPKPKTASGSPRAVAATPNAARDGLRGAASSAAAVVQGGKTATGLPEPRGIRPRSPDQTLMSPNLASPAAPRLDRNLDMVVGGGAACRTRCAQEKYFCQGGDEGGGCDEVWRKCVLACPIQSGATLIPGAP